MCDLSHFQCFSMTNERIRYNMIIMPFNNIVENDIINSGGERHNYIVEEWELGPLILKFKTSNNIRAFKSNSNATKPHPSICATHWMNNHHVSFQEYRHSEREFVSSMSLNERRRPIGVMRKQEMLVWTSTTKPLMRG